MAGIASPAVSGETVVAGIRTGPVPIDQAGARRAQQDLADGRELQRADPVAAARIDGLARGFSPDDTFTLFESDQGVARVHVRHAGIGFDLELVQPAEMGPGGVWFLREIRLARDGGA